MATQLWIWPHDGLCNNIRDLSVHCHYLALHASDGQDLGYGFTFYSECHQHLRCRVTRQISEGVEAPFVRDVLVLKTEGVDKVISVPSVDLPLITALVSQFVTFLFSPCQH
jgi:hypothetical protein